MDERTAERLLYVDATLIEMAELAERGRAAYDADIAVARACRRDRRRTSSTRRGAGAVIVAPTRNPA